jgi:hypothetical protein
MASRALPNPTGQPAPPNPHPRKYDGKSGPLYDEKLGGHYGERVTVAEAFVTFANSILYRRLPESKSHRRKR